MHLLEKLAPQDEAVSCTPAETLSEAL